MFRSRSQLGYNVFLSWTKELPLRRRAANTPISVRRGFPDDGEEAQRRIIMAEIPSPLGNITVINGYFPQGKAGNHPLRPAAQFYQNLQNYLETELKCDNPVLIMGDMNINPTDLDIGIGEERKHGCVPVNASFHRRSVNMDVTVTEVGISGHVPAGESASDG